MQAATTPIVTTTITSSATHSYSKLVDKVEPIEAICFETPRLTRRGSTESGFFSCLNEDFSAYRSTCCCSSAESSHDKCLESCCILSASKKDDSDVSNPNDIGVLIEESCSTNIGSLRSLDDLELSDSRRRFNCRHVLSQVDIDARSIDMGLINRLALDSEINSMMQKSQFSNQLLYCKNRTSSIYTDSSDDISSLAGSDSLLWDERSYMPNTRSAQIAKIVEYFERKGQNFKHLSVPDSIKHSSFIGSVAGVYFSIYLR